MEGNTTTSGYEEVRQHLLQDGFTQDENIFVREMTHHQSVMINGQECGKEIKQQYMIEYIGEGWREEHGEQTPIYGFTIKPDGKTSALDVWVTGWSEFEELLNA